MSSLLLLLAMLLTLSGAQQTPDNPCAQYFQYVRTSLGSFQGELMLSLQNGRNRIDLRFSQPGVEDQAAVGTLLPYPDEATVRASVGTVRFRLSFWPNPSGLLPKLTRLVFNDVTLCTASEYAPPHSYFNRFYVLPARGSQSPRQLSPPTVINTFTEGQSDVEVKTLFFDASGGKQLPPEAIPHFLADWVNEKPSTAVASWPAWPPTITSTTASVASWEGWPTNSVATTSPVPVPAPAPAPTPVPAAWPAATPAPPSIPSISRITPQTKPTLQIGGSGIVCGQEGAATPFIQRGVEYARGRYPWLTAIYHKESFSLAFKCGGSLVSHNLVITAAHCVYSMKEDRVVAALGRYDLDNYNEDGAEVREVMRIRTHPEYSTRLNLQPEADIALVTLQRPVVFNDIISPICLWESTESTTVEEFASIAGWGTDENGNSMTRYPRVVGAKIATEAECAHKWKVQKALGRTLCAGNLDGSGPCLGDSGGGLMVKRNNRWLLRGIVSQGERHSVTHCNLDQYVLYCDLSKHSTWITENIN